MPRIVVVKMLLITRSALAIALALAPSGAAGDVYAVADGESISEVLSRVEPADTIVLLGKEYRENIVIDVPITLTGNDYPAIRGGYEGNVVHVTAPGTVLEGLRISEAGPHLTKDMACVLVEADDVTVRNCAITESLHGIYVKAGNRTSIVGNTIEGRLDLIEADRGNGIHLWNSIGNRVADNEIFNVRDGIYFSFAHETEVARNLIHQVRYGLHYMYSNDNRFSDNLFEHNVAGAALMYSERISFDRNIFARCRGFRAYGILLQSMSRVTSTANLVLDNSRGIFMNNTNSSVFENNDVVDNDLSVQLNGGCDGNRFVGNNFINNLSELLLDVSDRETRWADDQSGNHWTRYRGYDLDRDGVGDVPFSIQNVFQIMETNVPEVRFYVLSPAAEILRVAEQALPILNIGEATDPLPLMRPAANDDVPWEDAVYVVTDPSVTWAVVYALTVLMPVGAMAEIGRRRRPSGRARRGGGQ